MITIFTIPKPFDKEHIKIIQTNAILSWLKLQPKCQVILFGDEEGIAEAAKKLGVQHVSDIRRNDFGTPLLDHVFRTAHEIAEHDILCYVNGDIILMSDFIQAVQKVSRKMGKFLVVGRRWNVDISETLDFESTKWEIKLKDYVKDKGQLFSECALDYFAFTRKLFHDIPPFAVGRAGWDNWMVYKARKLNKPVVDITDSVMAVHQNHDYSHHSMGKEGVFKGIEAERNKALAGGKEHFFDLEDITHVLTESGPRLDLKRERLRQHFYRLHILFPYSYPLVKLIHSSVRLLKLLRLYSI